MALVKTPKYKKSRTISISHRTKTPTNPARPGTMVSRQTSKKKNTLLGGRGTYLKALTQTNLTGSKQMIRVGRIKRPDNNIRTDPKTTPIIPSSLSSNMKG
jgi:hypothetical protein